jgi:hypothetical protein
VAAAVMVHVLVGTVIMGSSSGGSRVVFGAGSLGQYRSGKSAGGTEKHVSTIHENLRNRFGYAASAPMIRLIFWAIKHFSPVIWGLKCKNLLNNRVSH